jgi:hypothetical protein
LRKNGLKFIFDVQPRPSHMVSRTRVIDINDPAATRVIKTAEIAASRAAQDVVTMGNITSSRRHKDLSRHRSRASARKL